MFYQLLKVYVALSASLPVQPVCRWCVSGLLPTGSVLRIAGIPPSCSSYYVFVAQVTDLSAPYKADWEGQNYWYSCCQNFGLLTENTHGLFLQYPTICSSELQWTGWAGEAHPGCFGAVLFACCHCSSSTELLGFCRVYSIWLVALLTPGYLTHKGFDF